MLRYVLILPPLLFLLLGCGRNEGQAIRQEPAPTTVHRPEQAAMRTRSASTERSFTVTDVDRRSTTVKIEEDRVRFDRIRQPIVTVTIFAPWCPPCRGMMPTLEGIQTRNASDLFVLGLPVRSEMNASTLRQYMSRNRISYFISDSPDNEALARGLAAMAGIGENYPLPLTLFFKEGIYRYAIEGAAPPEMIQRVTDQLKKR